MAEQYVPRRGFSQSSTSRLATFSRSRASGSPRPPGAARLSVQRPRCAGRFAQDVFGEQQLSQRIVVSEQYILAHFMPATLSPCRL